jgi:cephalosporin hydroxylase
MSVRTSQADGIATAAIAAGAAQKHAELTGLVEHVLARQPRVVVEIGTMSGGTLRAWCECAADDALIVSIDLPNGRWGGGYHERDVPRLRGYARDGQRVELIAGDSHHPGIRAKLVKVLDGAPIDFLFVDGDHTYPGVKADFKDYAPLVRAGGWIAFHDVLDHPQVPDCDVSVLWDEIRDRFDTREFAVEGDERGYGPWGGIGALRWPG